MCSASPSESSNRRSARIKTCVGRTVYERETSTESSTSDGEIPSDEDDDEDDDLDGFVDNDLVEDDAEEDQGRKPWLVESTIY